jgi:two-component system, NtrC family, response regulator AtoC
MVVVFEPPSAFAVLMISHGPPRVPIANVLAELPVVVQTASDNKTGFRWVQKRRPQLVFIDIPETAGAMELVSQISAFDRGIEIVLLAREYSTDWAIAAVQTGAADILAGPFSPEQLKRRVLEALEAAERKRRIGELDSELLSSFRFHGMVGRSPRLPEVVKKMTRIAPHFGTVLISGASGTGKELVAQALHSLSPVAGGPFIICNCAALPESLAESQLFGFQKGAFTGALADAVGFFEQANHGTILLDEIGEMNIALQAKLLRVLQTHEVQRLGSRDVRRLKIRVIAATNRDLHSEVAQHRFREDLFYRLSAVHLHLPALAERMEDLPLLQKHFVQKFSEKYGKPISGITRRAQAALAQHRWPGNVRELENVIAGACLMSEGTVLDLADFPSSFQSEKPVADDCALVPLKDAQKKYVLQVLQAVDGNKARAAEILKISRSTLYSILADQDLQEII